MYLTVQFNSNIISNKRKNLIKCKVQIQVTDDSKYITKLIQEESRNCKIIRKRDPLSPFGQNIRNGLDKVIVFCMIV